MGVAKPRPLQIGAGGWQMKRKPTDQPKRPEFFEEVDRSLCSERPVIQTEAILETTLEVVQEVIAQSDL